MTNSSDVEIAVIGGGAAGIAAARTLHDAGADVLLVEARERLGGRAYTIEHPLVGGLDLGCGWLHSGDVNPWTGIAEAQGKTVDRSPPPWTRRTLETGFPSAEQEAFQAAMAAFNERLHDAADRPQDLAADELLEPGGRWNALIGAIYTYISGGELDRLSVRDLGAYADTGVNWRVEGGYGRAITAHAGGVPIALGKRVTRIEHSGKRIRIVTEAGEIACDRAIVTLPVSLIAAETVAFDPPLTSKVEAAAGIPLGLADKLYMALDRADEFDPDSRVFGRTDCSRTAAYHLRAHGRPLVEAYYGGDLAAELEKGGVAAFFDHASGELADEFGADFRKRLRPIAHHGWLTDPLARGSYSFALPGRAADRAVLAETVDDRLFFAGEACSEHDFSTAHGAYRTGVAAAEAVLKAMKPR